MKMLNIKYINQGIDYCWTFLFKELKLSIFKKFRNTFRDLLKDFAIFSKRHENSSINNKNSEETQRENETLQEVKSSKKSEKL